MCVIVRCTIEYSSTTMVRFSVRAPNILHTSMSMTMYDTESRRCVISTHHRTHKHSAPLAPARPSNGKERRGGGSQWRREHKVYKAIES